MNHDRLYEYEFRCVDQPSRQRVWDVIADLIYVEMGRPEKILHSAAGRCEFMNAVGAKECWIVDEVAYAEAVRGSRGRLASSWRATMPTGSQ